jgi:tetratricopeptide (TPR) repeat protein
MALLKRLLRPAKQDPISVSQIEALFNEAIDLHRRGQVGDAELIYLSIIEAQPRNFQVLRLLGVAASQSANPQGALEWIAKAIAVKPDFTEAYLDRGNVLHSLGQLDAALASYDIAIGLAPNFGEAFFNRGNVLRELRRLEPALASFDRALELDPGLVTAHYNRGRVLQELGRLESAIASYDRAIALKPDFVGAHSNRGTLLQELQRPEEALASYNAAIALKPDFAEGYSNRGTALQELQRLDEALASFDRAVALKPDYGESHWNRALAMLLAGDYENGWREFEWRWKTTEVLGSFKREEMGAAPWTGQESLSEKSILLYCEQGLGDAIQFCRYTKLLAERGARVVIEADRSLVRLFTTLEGVGEVVAVGDKRPKCDFFCSMLSLPLAFQTTLSSVPAAVPYLKAEPDKVLAWKTKLDGDSRPKVGLVWSGGFRPNHPELWSVNRRRNIALRKLAPLKNPEIEFYSLQKGQPAASELLGLIAEGWDGPAIIAGVEEQVLDFADTAALIENLDLIISVDTSTAHLAGALGKPVWILNRFDTDWRWLLHREDSPWYPSVKLYRQESLGAWDPVILRVRDDLAAWAKSARAKDSAGATAS